MLFSWESRGFQLRFRTDRGIEPYSYYTAALSKLLARGLYETAGQKHLSQKLSPHFLGISIKTIPQLACEPSRIYVILILDSYAER